MNPDERPPRLKRLDQLFTTHPLYFVTACTANRKPVLANAKVHDDFRKFCAAGLACGVFVGKYVLMPDHLHLFVAFGEEYEMGIHQRRRLRTDGTSGTHRDGATAKSAVASVYDRRGERRSQSAATGLVVAEGCDRRFSPLSEWMKSLKNSLSKTLRGMHVHPPHWQKGFFDHALRSEESYSEKWIYVAENPVRQRLVTLPEDWPYQGEIHPLQSQGHAP